ncbi:MAG: putative toxin-antitoxin system toxin component, PIN family [Treponema sp.]|nr:putative toxin-antitoxin system toxin component, PIN family [Treponema sp.]
MRYYAVLDTNVLVSYMLTKMPDSKVVKCVNLIREDKIIPLYNQTILREYTEVLNRDHFGFERNKVEELIDLVNKKGIDSQASPVEGFFPDPDDVVFYEVAMSREDSYLVTGNLKHFPKNGRVVTPAEMLQIIEFGELPKGLLNAPDRPEYMSMTLDEINAVIRQVRREMQCGAWK